MHDDGGDQHKLHSLVEGAHKRPMAGLGRRLAGLDARRLRFHDFFLFLMAPIAKEFGVPLTEVAIVFSLTLWMRLVGATAAGWLADRLGRKKPLMISIAWYSACNFIAGFSPAFWFLFLFRALLGIGMGAEWPAGAALAMEQWPIRSRRFVGWGAASVVGSRKGTVERRLRAPL